VGVHSLKREKNGKKRKPASFLSLRFACDTLHFPTMSDTWLEACHCHELPPGSRKLVKLNGIEIALFNIGGSVYAIKNRCPHRSGPLIRGFTDEAGGVKCPMHGWRFDLKDGRSERPARATVYPVKVTNGRLYLLV
jgi:3-phenylpropionate/trans-cinnamate dioxygenase ferredoxin subunit